MRSFVKRCPLLAAVLLPFFHAAVANTAVAQGHSKHDHDHREHQHRSAESAPAGVMYEHMHPAGQMMVSYRVDYERANQLFHGSQRITDSRLQDAGFSGVPEVMSMQMHMLHFMYAPTDWLNLMIMPQLMNMDMNMDMAMHSGDHGDGHGGAIAGRHTHRTSGIGDTVVAALVHIARSGRHAVHGGLGISIPSGSVDEVGDDGRAVGYGMQLGSGTWDAIPIVTYTGEAADWSWGGQVNATLRLEEENSSGFQFGNQYRGTVWSAYRLIDWASISLRLQYLKEGGIRGHYNLAHNHSSPGDRQANFGGEFWDIGLGANFIIPTGSLVSHRIGIEWLENAHEHYRGYQLGSARTLILHWSAAF